MKVRLLLVSVFLLSTFGSSAADKPLTDKQFAPILKYYSDCTYVASNGSLDEIGRIVSMLREAQKPRFGLLDFKGRKIYEAIAATQGVVLDPDPGILALRLPGLEYFFKTTPVEVVDADNQAVSIRVKRESTWPVERFARPAAESTIVEKSGPYTPLTFDGSRADGSGVRVATEIDEWVKVGGAWRLKSLHYYLL